MIAYLLALQLLANPSAGPAWLAELTRADQLLKAQKTADAEAALSRARLLAERDGPRALPAGIVALATGKHHYTRSRLMEATRSLEQAHGIFTSQLSQNHHLTVDAAIQLSSVYLETGQPAKAASLLRRHLDANDPLAAGDRAALLGDLGSVLLYRGRTAEAERAFQEALAVFESDTSHQSRERKLIAISNLAGVYLTTGRIREAVALAEQARELLATLPNPDPVVAAKTFANLASAYTSAKSHPTRAEAFFQSAIRLCEQELPPEHPLLGQILLNYADFLRSQKRNADAVAARKRGQTLQAAFVRRNLLHHVVDASTLREGAR